MKTPDLPMLDRLPEGVARGLQDFQDVAARLLGPSLQALVLFGSGAEGRLRVTSDLNLLLVLRELTPQALADLREPLRQMETLHRARFMLLLQEEVPAALEAFPDKFMDILRRHQVLLGSDPFVGLVIDPLRLRQKVSQSLLNQTLRLREAYALRSLREEQAERALADAAGPLRSEAANLLGLEGVDLAPKEALASLAGALPGGPWDDVLGALSQVREGTPLAPGAAPGFLLRLADLAHQLHRRSLEARA